MYVQADVFAFTIPPGVIDVTNYSFTASETMEMLNVTAGVLSESVDTLDTLLAVRRRDLEFVLMAEVTIQGEGVSRLAGLPARTLTFILTHELEPVYEQWTLALDTPESYVQVAYAVPADDGKARARIDHAVKSARLTDEMPGTPVGWARRWAGKLWIDVPAHLDLPRTYQFLSADEKIRVEVAHFAKEASPSITSELSEDMSLGEMLTVSSRSVISAGQLTGTLYVFVLSRTEDDSKIEDVVQRAHFDVGHRREVHVYGRARLINLKPLDAMFKMLVQSLEPTTPPSSEIL